MSTRDLLTKGLSLFNAEKYFEAHEVWEDLWRVTDGPLRAFYQGMIQAAVALYHLRRNNVAGAGQQIGKSLKNLAAGIGEDHGIDAPDLIAQLTAIRDQMQYKKVRIRLLKPSA